MRFLFGTSQGSYPAKRGFTLIELLVVIAIISLLIAILLPSLEAARRQAKKVTCLANLKGIGSASRVYEADDPNGWGIPVHPLQFSQCEQQEKGGCTSPSFIGAYEWGGKSGAGQTDFLPGNPLNPLNSKYGTQAGFGPASRPMNRILFSSGFQDFTKPSFNSKGALDDTKLDLPGFRCPADDGAPRGAHCEDWWKNKPEMTSYDFFGNSYAANLFMVANSGGGPMFSNSPYMRPVTRIPSPARTLYYEENIGRWAWAAKNDPCQFLPGVDPGPTKSIRGWHGEDWTYNRVFVDAHAETQRVFIAGTETADGFANHYRWEQLSSYPPFNGQKSTFESMKCIIVRGDGWQKDTLPAEPITTGLIHAGGDRPSYENCVKGG